MLSSISEHNQTTIIQANFLSGKTFTFQLSYIMQCSGLLHVSASEKQIAMLQNEGVTNLLPRLQEMIRLRCALRLAIKQVFMFANVIMSHTITTVLKIKFATDTDLEF